MIRIARLTALLSFLGLFFLLVAWHAYIEPPAQFPRALLLLLLAGPLLFALRGIIHGRPYTHAWTSFLALFYFTLGVFEAAGTPPKPALPWALMALSLLLFTGSTAYARLRGREMRDAREASTAGER